MPAKQQPIAVVIVIVRTRPTRICAGIAAWACEAIGKGSEFRYERHLPGSRSVRMPEGHAARHTFWPNDSPEVGTSLPPRSAMRACVSRSVPPGPLRRLRRHRPVKVSPPAERQSSTLPGPARPAGSTMPCYRSRPRRTCLYPRPAPASPDCAASPAPPLIRHHPAPTPRRAPVLLVKGPG